MHPLDGPARQSDVDELLNDIRQAYPYLAISEDPCDLSTTFYYCRPDPREVPVDYLVNARGIL